MVAYVSWLVLCPILVVFVTAQNIQKPNIVLVVADDYGFNDIGYHGIDHGSAIKTPFLDSLAMSGIRLENYYVQPICSPTRSQLMSGRYQIHTGLQHGVIRPSQPNAVPIDNILLPEQLKKCSYSTHMLGKWHLGFYKEEYLPWKRGFDSYYGYLVGAEDYYTKYRCFEDMCGYSMDSNAGPSNETYGEYSANLYARKVEELVQNYNKSNPMFLYIALQSVHGPLQVPEKYIKPYLHIKNENRRIYAGMVAAMDEAIKNITEHLKKAGMWDDTLFIFSTDNGGQTEAGGNNWPLRGRKATLWEGGVRGVGFVHGKILNVPNPNMKTNNQLIHVSDWYPTLLHAAGCPVLPETQMLDGFDQWKSITTYAESPRSEILHNIDPLSTLHDKKIVMGFDTSVHAAIRSGDWKLLTGDPGFDEWVKPPEMKNAATMHINNMETAKKMNQSSSTVQLYNIKNDPYERMEISAENPAIVTQLLARLVKYNSTSVPVRYPPSDPNANPKLHRDFWEPWEK